MSFENSHGNASSVLAESPPFGEERDRLCSSLLGLDSLDSSKTDFLGISYMMDPGEILEGLGEFFDEPPANVYVIYVSETKTVKQEDLLRDEVSEKLAARTKVETAEPQNLTEIGMRLTTMTEAYQESESENLVTCYDSVNYLLQYVDSTETAFKFLNTFTSVLHSYDAVSHYHIDPDAVDEKDVKMLLPIFDDVVSLDDTSGDSSG